MPDLNLFYLLLLVPYFPMIGRLLFFFANDSFRPLHFLNRWVGKGELYFGWLRDGSASVFILILFSGRLIEWYQIGIAPAWPFELVLIPFIAYSRWWRWHGLAPMHELGRKNPTIHPTEFFEHLHACLGFLPHRVPEKAKRRIDPDHLNFRTGKRPTKSFWILLRGAYNTFLLSILAYKAFKWKGAQYIRLTGSGLSIVWASRLAQIAQMEVKVFHPTQKEFPRGKKIFAPNHKSFFDFCLLPLAYYRTKKDGSADNFIPSTMIAKDHFRDNFLLYHVIGFGKMLEAWGNVFVDRKSKEVNKAQVQVTQTVKKLISSDVDFEIYPQGKRAWGQWGRDGDRWDSGYFCVGNKKRLKQEDGHFKKGVAYIACETAFSLLKHRLGGTVTVLPIGISGVGTACPTKSLKV
ncbi:MAG: 1-acyl-sn-glycerol-3-phosphate acyltransferase, partial [Deltaproteobacteria bacterium]|nr:1-acyl-sn-glycerol-3-phosphate acyltransferase [Deltaproteobacteria bacterium]